MYRYDAELDDTKQQRAFTKLMDRRSYPPTTVQLKHERCEGQLQLDWFIKTHDFVSLITDLGNETYDVEYMA
jgi:hypothetical protein